MEQLDCEVLGVDWTVNLGQARAQVGGSKALQGNLDPNVLFAPPQQVAAEARRVLDEFGSPHTGPAPAHAHLQPGARHQPAHAAGTRAGTGGSSARSFGACAPQAHAETSVIRVFPS
jgi:hypothetical protein